MKKQPEDFSIKVKKQPEDFSIKVNHLPLWVTELYLRQHFNKFGDILSVKINDSSNNEKYAYINFRSKESAQNALKENGKVVLGKTINIIGKWSDNPNPPSVAQETLKVLNVPTSQIAQKELESICKQFSDFKSLKINLEGFAYINFTAKEGAIQAMEHLNKISIHGSKLSAKFHKASQSNVTSSQYHIPTIMPISPLQPSGQTIKVTISDSTHISSEDLFQYFSRFGKIVQPPRIQSGCPDYAYINYSSSEEAEAASRKNKICSKGVELTIKLTGKMPIQTAIEKDLKQITCIDDALVDQILCSSHLDEMQKQLQAMSVHLKPCKQGGVVISGDKEKVEAAESVVNLQMSNIKSQIVSQSLQLHCQYIPIFDEPQIFQKIEKMNAVEFSASTSTSAKSLLSLSSTVAASSSSVRPMTVDFVSEYLLPAESSDQEYIWEFKDDNGTFVPMSPEVSAAVEKLYKGGDNGYLSRDKWRYFYNFSAMTQTNLSTSKVRKIQHSLSTCKLRIVNVNCRGLLHQVQISLKMLEQQLKHSITTKYLENCATHKKAMVELARSYCLDIDDSLPDKLLLHGSEKYLSKVLIMLKHKLLDLQACDVHTVHSVYPSEWEPQKNDVELKKVASHSTEWKNIELEMMKTMPDVVIKKIERIQNKGLYDKYNFCKRRMQKKNDGVVNEKWLFHGSRDCAPEKIYSSEHGFDFRFGNSGMWGNGAYFAVDAKYSASYSYRGHYGSQIFMAFVLTGCTVSKSPDSSLRVPPFKSGSEHERYDSVNGITHSSQIYVVYDHDKSYPAYLISF